MNARNAGMALLLGLGGVGAATIIGKAVKATYGTAKEVVPFYNAKQLHDNKKANEDMAKSMSDISETLRGMSGRNTVSDNSRNEQYVARPSKERQRYIQG